MSNPSQKFWVFSYAKGAGNKKGEEERWGVSALIDFSLLDDIRRKDGPIDCPTSVWVGRADRADRVEDVPWVYRDVYIVSDRVRQIIEEAGPDDCQFIPIDIRVGRKSLGLIYWVMHLNFTIECADSERSYNVNEAGEPPFYMRSIIVESFVPSSVSTFRIKHGTKSAIMRDSLRRRLTRAKVTGCMFYPP